MLPSNYEGQSNALLEAMMMGIPCISTNCAGADEIITDYENGYLVAVGSKEELISRIDFVLGHYESARKVGALARKTMTSFARDKVLKEWEQVLG